jgi:hypothetical protein
LLRKELEKLSLNFRESLILREIEGRPDRETADAIAPICLAGIAALQNLLMDVAAVVGATETDRA